MMEYGGRALRDAVVHIIDGVYWKSWYSFIRPKISTNYWRWLAGTHELVEQTDSPIGC